MTTPRHAKQTSTQGIHSTVAYKFLNAADRIAFTNEQSGNPWLGLAPTVDDIGKDALQLDNGSFWKLVNHSPVTWSALTVVMPWRQQEYTPTAGQVTFILTVVPTDSKTLTLTVNGVVADEGTDYTVSGVTITWLDVLYTMQTTDLVSVRYR